MRCDYTPNINIAVAGNASKPNADIIILDVHGSVGHDPKTSRTKQLQTLNQLKDTLKISTPWHIYSQKKNVQQLETLPHYAGDRFLTLQWLQVAFTHNSIEDLLDYLQLEHDFGVWKLVTATTKLLEKKAPTKKIVRIRVLQNRGIIDANRLMPEFSIRKTFDKDQSPDLYNAMASYNQGVLKTIDHELKTLSPDGFLFIPHSMNKVSKYMSEDLNPSESPGKLRDYVTNFTQLLAPERTDMYINQTPSGEILGKQLFYQQLETAFHQAGKPLLANLPYRATEISSSTKYLRNHPNSGVVEVRKDNIANLDYPDQSYCSHLMTQTDQAKINAYAELYVSAILGP